MRPLLILAAALLGTTLSVGSAHAATQADAAAALASAQAVEAEAGKLRNQWLPTEEALKTAKAEIAAGHFDAAVTAARFAEALAHRSIEQAQEQDRLWTDAVIK